MGLAASKGEVRGDEEAGGNLLSIFRLLVA